MPTTTPWYDELSTPGTKLTGDVNPIGFKGIFQFKEARDLHIYIRLMHARISKFNKRDHSPFALLRRPPPGSCKKMRGTSRCASR